MQGRNSPHKLKILLRQLSDEQVRQNWKIYFQHYKNSSITNKKQ